MENAKQKLGRGTPGSRGLFLALGAKKKTVFAGALVLLMAIMWVRVFGSKGPEAADAGQAAGTSVAENDKSEVEIVYVNLPKVHGRNDVIARDFFSMDGGLGTRTEVDVVTGGGANSIVRTVTKKVRLEAIDLSDEPRAFINDVMYGAGDRMLIKDGSDEYECEIVSVEENTVLIRCQQTEIKLKLAQDDDVVD